MNLLESMQARNHMKDETNITLPNEKGALTNVFDQIRKNTWQEARNNMQYATNKVTHRK